MKGNNNLELLLSQQCIVAIYGYFSKLAEFGNLVLIKYDFQNKAN